MKRKDLRKEIIKALKKRDKVYKCPDCFGFCNFGEYPYCRDGKK